MERNREKAEEEIFQSDRVESTRRQTTKADH